MNVVTNLFKKTARKLQRLVVGADTLWPTPEHPFFSNNKWINAAMLTAGMVLQSPFGSDTVKANVPVNDTAVTVYNFTVENNHNYYVGKGNYLVHNSCERISTLTNGLTEPALKSAFTNAIASNKNFADAVINGTVNIQDWVTLTKALGANSKIATDLKTLQKVKQIRNNADFSNALGNNALEEIIRGNNRASCATCQTAGTAAAKNMDEYLEDVEHFFNEFKNSTTDYLEVLAELRKAPSTSQNAAFDRAAEVIDHLNKNRQINKNAVQKFGGRFDIDVNVIDNCPNCSFFIELKNGQKIRLGVSNAGNDLLNYINSLINKNIRNSILELPESRVVAQKYFNRINENPANYLSDYTVHLNDFDTWYANVFKSELFEAHHIIPKNVLRDNANLQSILDWARNNGKTWDFGKIDNGIMLQKRRKNNIGEVVGDHANHPRYDEKIYQKIDDIIENSNGNMSDAYDDFAEFVNDLKQQINTEVVEGNLIINTITIP